MNYLAGAEHDGSFIDILKAFKYFIQNYKSDDQNMNNYILYINTITLLIEQSLSHGLIEFATILIQNLSEFIQKNNIDSKSFDFKSANSNQFIKYLSVNEIPNPSIDLKGLIYLYLCDLNLLKGNFKKA